MHILLHGKRRKCLLPWEATHQCKFEAGDIWFTVGVSQSFHCHDKMQDGDSCFLEEKGRLGHPTPEKTEAVLTAETDGARKCISTIEHSSPPVWFGLLITGLCGLVNVQLIFWSDQLSVIHMVALEGFAMNSPKTFFIVFPFWHPHLFESVQRGENGSSNPGGVESLLRSGDPDLDVLRRQLLHLREQSVPEAFEEGGAAREDNVLEENLPQIHVRLLDRVDQHLMQALILLSNEVRPEKQVWESDFKVFSKILTWWWSSK